MKTKIVILDNDPSERLAIEFFLVRAKVEGLFFDSEHEMKNWLQHCIDEESQVVAAIVQSSALELGTHHFPCGDILTRKRIPMIIAASARDIGDWCEVSNKLSAGLTVYLSPLTLLPQLLEHLRQGKEDAHSLAKRVNAEL